MDITRKCIFLTAWFSFLFAELWGLIWDIDFFAALERALWLAFVMAILGGIAGAMWESVLKEIHYFEEEKEEGTSAMTSIDYTLPEDLPLTDSNVREETIPDSDEGITSESFDKEIKKMTKENPGGVANLVKTQLKT